VLRTLVHTASFESQNGRIPEAKVESVMLSTALAAIAPTD